MSLSLCNWYVCAKVTDQKTIGNLGQVELIPRLAGLIWNPDAASQPAFTCSKLTIETLEQGVKYVQS